jgi:hypothetical protein
VNDTGVLYPGGVDVGLGVSVGEGGGDLTCDLKGVERGRATVGLHVLGQVLAVDVLHLEVVLVVVTPEVEDLHDVLVPELRQRLPLAAEACDGLIADGLVGPHFQCPDLVKAEAPHLVHGTLAALADFPDNLVLASDDHRAIQLLSERTAVTSSRREPLP